MDLNKLSTGDKLILGSTIGLFVFSFLPWFSVSVDGGSLVGSFSQDFSGWDVGFLWGRFPLFLAVLMAAYVGVRAFSPDTQVPTLPVAWGQALLGVGVLCAFLVILKLLIGEDAGGAADIAGVEINRSYGLFLSVLATVGLAVGGFFKMQEGDDDTANRGGATPPTTF